MAQQIQFIYLTQSDYDGLTPQTSKIYFTSDTKRIYKGVDLYAATTFDQLNFSTISASGIFVNGSAVSLEGHSHSMSDVSGLDSAISAATSIFATWGHQHVIADVTNLPGIVSGITTTGITKSDGNFTNLNATSIQASAMNVTGTGTFSSVSASAATFGNLVVTGDVSMTLSQVTFGSIVASDIQVDGTSVALVGHSHSIADIDGLSSTLSAYASASHGHSISDITNLPSILTGITSSSVEKDTVTADAGYFGEINASAISVNGTNVALEGHTHSQYAGSDHVHPELSGITSTTISKDTGTFTNLVVADASFTATHVEADSVIAASISASNLFVTNASFIATSVEADSIIAASISASTATFGDINVTGTASLNTTNVIASTLTAGSGTFSTLTVGGSNVALVGHTHNEYASSAHVHPELSGINANAITKNTGTFTNLIVASASFTATHVEADSVIAATISTSNLFVTNASFVATSVEADGVVAASVVASTVTADIGNFRLLSVSGSANFVVNNVSANAVTVNGTNVALVGHTHSVADIDGLSTTLSAYASASHQHAISDITNLEATLSEFASQAYVLA